MPLEGSGMIWILVFLYSWIIFLIFVDKKTLKPNVYGGLLAVVTGTLVDLAAHYFNLYHFNHQLSESSAYFLHAAGPMFTMGVLFMQYYCPDKKIQAANVLVFSLAYLAVETLIIMSGGANYIRWHFLVSLAVNISVFSGFSYVYGLFLTGKQRNV